jgi:hypothetical protein
MLGKAASEIRKISREKYGSSSDHSSSSGSDSDWSAGEESHVLPGSRQMMKMWAVRCSGKDSLTT